MTGKLKDYRSGGDYHRSTVRCAEPPFVERHLRGWHTQVCGRKGCTQLCRLSGITQRTYPLPTTRLCSHSLPRWFKSCGVAIKWLTKTVWNNLSDVSAPAGFFFFPPRRTRGHIKRIKYWPEWRRSQLESQPDTLILVALALLRRHAVGNSFRHLNADGLKKKKKTTGRARILINVWKNRFFFCF